MDIPNWHRVIYGGKTGLKEFYQFYYDKLYYLGLKYTTDVHIIEDSIQNLFINLIKYRKTLPEVQSVNGYLYKSFQRVLIREINQRNKIVSEPEFNDLDLGTSSTEDPIIFSIEEKKGHRVRKVTRIIKTLPPKQQEAIYLKFTLGLTYIEMAEYLNIEVESVRVIISRAIANIRIEFYKDVNIKKMLFAPVKVNKTML